MNRKLVKRIVLSTLAVVFIATGVPFMAKSNIGADCVTVLYDALSNKAGLTIGKWTFIFGVIELIIVLILDKSKIGYTTLLYVMCAQFVIDFVSTHIKLQTSLIMGVIYVLIGILLMSIGCVMALVSGLGLTIYDALCFSISDCFKVKYVIIRYLIDGLHLIFGIVLGGKVGVGTLLSILIFGFVIQGLKKLMYEPLITWISK